MTNEHKYIANEPFYSGAKMILLAGKRLQK